ncbi:Mitochondrial cardiolipin hydrolase [Mactra antiquata]
MISFSSRWVKVCFGAITFGAVSELVYFTYRKYKRRKWQTNQNESESRKVTEEVLFFPDDRVACKDYFVGEDGCNNNDCRFTHFPNSLSRLYEFINGAKGRLDVCVFVICCIDLADLLIAAHKRHVLVRVISDGEQTEITGSQIWNLRKAGIAVRTNKSSFLMHHKFVVIDDQLLLNGSFNWTRQAISGNQENLMALGNKRIVSLYTNEFERLWNAFDPQKNG